MNFLNIQKIFIIVLVAAIGVCGYVFYKKSPGVAGLQTPTAAYQKLYTAVKAKDYATIKSLLSKQTITFAEGQSKNTKQTFEQMIANGFTATTFSSAMPEIRDERIKDNMGAVEVWNSKDSKWEDIYFINEDGWKLAVGDAFRGSYKSPGKGRAQIESEANPDANKMVMMPTNADLSPMNSNSNAANANANTKTTNANTKTK